MIIALYTILIVYLILITSFIVGFKKHKEFKPQNKTESVGFSVIIPFRNEVNRLPFLLESLLKVDYPTTHFECLFVDDASSDTSVEMIESELQQSNISFQILTNQRQSKSPKKDAIVTAIQQAKFNWILTTDADCMVPSTWLQTFADFSQQQPTQMMVGPVSYESVNYTFLEHFQMLDFLSLQGSTIGGFGIGKPFLCNGANLAYKRETFLALNGFDGNSNIASGDDIFLFEKFLQSYPNEVLFLKSKLAMVTTFALESWKDVMQQRIRWAAKSSSYNLWFAKFVGLVVFLANVVFICAIGLTLWNRHYWNDLLIIGVLKMVVDARLIIDTSQYYRGKKKRVRDLAFASLLYPFFTVSIALRALGSGYRWKGRNFQK
jgi:cellulose synthase/poly-beta-1,6-N-acetylglucosamine synthase-like glycosyltransferase